MLRILVADDHPVVREGLKQIISRMTDMSIAAEASDGQEVMDKLNKTKVDVVILDLSMPGRNGLETLVQIHGQWSKLPILVLSQFPEEQYALRVFKAGAAGYLMKETASEELILAIRKIARGGKYVSESLAEQLASQLDAQFEKPAHAILSDREFQVLCKIAQGKSPTEIAKELSLSIKTVSTYRTRILEKLGKKNNAELIRYSIEHQLVELKPLNS
jgi:DNA-binding NarL/FixJ family response regulator